MTSSTTTTKPALVLVHGACHQPSHFRTFELRLRSHGYTTASFPLPSSDTAKPVQTLKPDIAIIRRAIVSHLDRGMDVVLIMHSIGSLAGSAAVEGLTRKNRRGGAGEEKAVVKLLYMAAIIVDIGTSVLQAGGGQHVPAVHFPLPEPENEGFMSFHSPIENLYNECQPDVARDAVGKLKLFSEAMCHQPVPYAGWKDVDSYYLVCERDAIFPVLVQETWARSEGGKWRGVKKIDADHSPYLSRTEETVKWVVECVEDE